VHSLLRGFSAPVQVTTGYRMSERRSCCTLSHDTDAFNRWGCGQALAARSPAAVPCGPAPASGPDDGLDKALRAVLRDPSLDPAFKALALTPPSESYVAEQLQSHDPQRIHTVREQWRALLADRLQDHWVWAYEAHEVREGYSPSPSQAGRRALANLALSLLCLHAVRVGDSVWPGRAHQRFKDAGNMTDKLGAITALVDSHSGLVAAALQRFHAQAAGDALVVDKWFTLQARAPEPLGVHAGSAFARAKALLSTRTSPCAIPIGSAACCDPVHG
jgi:aminopeptidase N